MNREGAGPAAGQLDLPPGVRQGHANLVHVDFVPTQVSLVPVAGPTEDRVGTSPDAHRFNASRAGADAAIAEWRAFVDEVRSSKRRRSR